VLEGSVRKSGARVRITAQPIDAATGGHLWAERFDRDLADIFAVQDDVTTQIVAALALNLSVGDRQSIVAEHTDSHEAYDCRLRGREFFWREAKEANRTAQTLFRRAIEQDRGFTPAFAFLAGAQVIAYASGWSASTPGAYSLWALALGSL
jgi:adenylate cyclase